MSGSHERDPIEPGDRGTDVQLSRYQLIAAVAPLVELASGAALIQRGHKGLVMPVEERHRR